MPNLEYAPPSDAELSILQALWDREPQTVREIHERIVEHKAVTYTTTLKQVQRMIPKRLLARVETGEGHYYRALVTEKDIQQNLMNKLLHTAFRGAASELALSALGQVETSEEELDALEEWLNQQRKNKS